MKDRLRREQAQSRAETYAPRPKDTRLIYVIIAVSMLLVGMVALGAFYNIDLWKQPAVVLLLVAVASVAALVLRWRQTHRHNQAHRYEYGEHPEPTPEE